MGSQQSGKRNSHIVKAATDHGILFVDVARRLNMSLPDFLTAISKKKMSEEEVKRFTDVIDEIAKEQ